MTAGPWWATTSPSVPQRGYVGSVLASTYIDNAASWRLAGRPLRVAAAVAALLLVGVLAGAAYDLASPVERRPVPLEIATFVGKLVVAGGLTIVARRTGSISLRLLAVLAGLLAVAGLLPTIDLVNTAINGVAGVMSDVVGISGVAARLGLLFIALGVAALGLIVVAWTKARPDERPVVKALIVMFAVVGVFAGPTNAIAALGISREWLFAEDFGQAVMVAVMAGYVAGLVAATPSPGSESWR